MPSEKCGVAGCGGTTGGGASSHSKEAHEAAHNKVMAERNSPESKAFDRRVAISHKTVDARNNTHILFRKNRPINKKST